MDSSQLRVLPLLVVLGLGAVALSTATKPTLPTSSTNDRPTSPSTEVSSLSKEEKWINDSIIQTIPPAAKLGIQVHSLDEETESVTLCMPLEENKNVHGTCFAGSLSSIAALSSWYTVVCFLRKRKLADKYTVVIASSDVSYKRPVKDTTMVLAQSFLPEQKECLAFLNCLQWEGKSYLDVVGKVPCGGDGDGDGVGDDGSANEKNAVLYTSVICAYKPRPKQETTRVVHQRGEREEES